MGLLEGSYYSKIAVLCLVFAVLLHLISFGAPNWAETNTQVVSRKDHYGLWRFCTMPKGGVSDCSDFIDYTTSDWMKCCQAFMTLAMFTMIGTLAVTAKQGFAPSDGNNRVLIIGMAMGGITTLFMLISIAVFGARYWEWFPNRDSSYGDDAGMLGWAFYIGVCSLCLTFASTGLLLIEMLFGEDV